MDLMFASACFAQMQNDVLPPIPLAGNGSAGAAVSEFATTGNKISPGAGHAGDCVSFAAPTPVPEATEGKLVLSNDCGKCPDVKRLDCRGLSVVPHRKFPLVSVFTGRMFFLRLILFPLFPGSCSRDKY